MTDMSDARGRRKEEFATNCREQKKKVRKEISEVGLPPGLRALPAGGEGSRRSAARTRTQSTSIFSPPGGQSLLTSRGMDTFGITLQLRVYVRASV